MLLAALCTASSATCILESGETIRHDFRLPTLPDDKPVDPDSPTHRLPKLRSNLDSRGDERFNPAKMSDEEREAFLAAEVQNDSQPVVDCVIRFGYWRDTWGTLHQHADWALCTVAELPPRIAHSRLPVCQQTSAPPPADPLPRDDGELSLAIWRFGSEQRRITAVNRYLAHGRQRSACLQLAAQFDAVANWLRDIAS